MKPVIVSFFTPDHDYRQHAERLRGECEALGIEHCIEERPSAGGYLENCCIKPFFIREMLKRHQRPVLWVDVDASIYRVPTFFDDLDADFAARRMPKRRTRTWHVGTLWFNHTPSVLRFVDRWCDLTGAESDEAALDVAWLEGPDLRVVELPPEYFVLPVSRVITPVMPERSVITHRLSNWAGKDAQRHRFGT